MKGLAGKTAGAELFNHSEGTQVGHTALSMDINPYLWILIWFKLGVRKILFLLDLTE